MGKDDNKDDENNEMVGYGRPPKKHQFKKHQSGCPTGGHEQRKAKAKARADAEKEKEKQADKALVGLVRKLGAELVSVKRGGEVINMPRVEAMLRQVLDRAMRPEASAREVAQAIALYKHAKLLDPAPAKSRSGVLVVYPPMKQDEWAKATEGELLPKNPLEGIPGAEGLLETEKPRGAIPDDKAA